MRVRPSGLIRALVLSCKKKVQSSRGPPYHKWDCFSLVRSSNPPSRFVNSQINCMVCLLPDGIFNYITFIWNICFLFHWYN